MWQLLGLPLAVSRFYEHLSLSFRWEITRTVAGNRPTDALASACLSRLVFTIIINTIYLYRKRTQPWTDFLSHKFWHCLSHKFFSGYGSACWKSDVQISKTKDVPSRGWFSIKCYLLIRMFLRSGTDGQNSVTNGVFCLFCRADILSPNLIPESIF